MASLRSGLVFAIGGAILVIALASEADSVSNDPRRDAGPPADGGIPACVLVKTESRYVPYGYKHIVILTNGCTRPAKCIVSTDVNPQPQTVVVLAGATTEVLTFLSAASSTFVARVSCVLHT